MAEMLVDSTKLDACLDAEADAIRAKTGDSNDIAFDFANNKGFADAIAAIPSGGTESPLHFCGTVTLTNSAVTQITVPISESELVLSGAERIIALYRLVKTGVVVDGDVTWDDNVTLRGSSSSYWSVGGQSHKGGFSSKPIYFADGTLSGTKSLFNNTTYRVANGNNGANTGGGEVTITTSTNSIKFTSGSYDLCKAGYATIVEYHVFVFPESGTPFYDTL